MEYDVLEEARHAVNDLEENAWENHKEEYINSKGAIDEFNDRIDAQELALEDATTDQEVQIAQEKLTKIIDDILEFNDDFNSSLTVVDTSNEIMDPTDNFEINNQAINEFLSNMSE